MSANARVDSVGRWTSLTRAWSVFSSSGMDPGHPSASSMKRLGGSMTAPHASRRGYPIRLLMALAVPADDYAFGVFAAESAEAVAQLCADAGAPAERISTAVGWSRALDC